MDFLSIDSYLDSYYQQEQSYLDITPINMHPNSAYEIRPIVPEFEQYHQPFPEQNYMMDNQQNFGDFYQY